MRIYISGKISGLPIDEASQNFILAKTSIKIVRSSADVVSPFELRPFLGIRTWFCYMITDLLALRKCTHIALLPNWTDSRWAVIEYYFAKFVYKQKIIFLD